MSYTINITESELESIQFIGARYCWSDWAASNLTFGDNVIAEHIAWDFAEAIDRDTEGGHSPFPMLNERSELHSKLTTFRDSIV